MAEPTDLESMAEPTDLESMALESEEFETLGSYWPIEFDHEEEEEEEIYSSQSDLDQDPDLDPFDEEFISSDHHHLSEEQQQQQITRFETFGSDTDSVAELHDFLGEQDHQVNLSNLDSVDEFNDQDPFFRGQNDDNLDLGLGLGLGRIDEELEEENGEFMLDVDDNDVDEEEEEERDSLCEEDNSFRVLGFGSDTDGEVDEALFGDGFMEEIHDDIDIPLRWDSLQLEDEDNNGRDIGDENDFCEWEEVGDRVEEGEVLGAMMDYEERLDAVEGSIREMLEEEERLTNMEWQVLLQAHNLERNLEDLEHELDHDFLYPVEYDTVFGQFAEHDNAICGSPPTAKSVVENLPSIVLTQDALKNKGSLCAVCKDEITTEERAKVLPCSHYYHGDCILPWLNIRNTCPVCRFELPTDDPVYERRRAERASGVPQVRYDIQMFPED